MTDKSNVETGKRYRFNYAYTDQAYLKYAGQEVVVVSPLPSEQFDETEVGPMFRIRADDGWEGEAFIDELEACK